MDILTYYRNTNATIDLGAIRDNLELIRQSVAPAKVCGVIKANAYGHGDIEVARVLEAAGVPMLAVALVEEGIRLRDHGITTPVLVLGGALGEDYGALGKHILTPAIFTEEHLHKLADAAGDRSQSFHLKLDTGMGRLGLRLHELPGFIKNLTRYPTLQLTGVLTHLANADLRDDERNTTQQALFNQAVESLKEAGISPKWRHLSSSSGILTLGDTSTNLVRAGLALYGLDPVSPPTGAALRPALSFRTTIVHLKSVPIGDRISYGGHWEAKRPSIIATLPVGYADGYPRSLAGKASVLIGGRRAPIVGTICMDLCMADVTDIPEVATGDEAVLLGEQGEEAISAYELARWADTIPYEITTGIRDRVPRKHTPPPQGR